MFERELQKLKRLYREGLFSKPYYSRSLEGIESFSSYESFCRIPFMTKDSIRSTPIMERTNTDLKDIYGVFSSSGTTGSKTFYVYNRNDKRVHSEFVKTFFTQLGITPLDIGGVMAPVGTGVMAHTMLWQFEQMGAGYVNCPEPTPENMLEFVEKVPITVIATRPSIVSSVAYSPEWMERAQRSCVKTLALGGGFLSEQRRALLERVWGADCYNLLGMSEMFGPLASECRQKDGLHYLDRYLMIEVIDPKSMEPLPEGQAGVAVYTTLWSKGFPLLRYWTDDMIKIDRSPCACGSELPRIRYIGRRADMFNLPDGPVYPEQVENTLFSFGFIGDYKVSRDKSGFIVYTESEDRGVPDAMLRQLEALFGGKVRVEFLGRGALNYHGVGKRFESTDSREDIADEEV